MLLSIVVNEVNWSRPRRPLCGICRAKCGDACAQTDTSTREASRRSREYRFVKEAGIAKLPDPPKRWIRESGWVELAGIEPASLSAEPGLLRVQSAVCAFLGPGACTDTCTDGLSRD
jgi:hypothetical protein